MDLSNSAESRPSPRVDEKDPKTWPPCACGAAAVGIVTIDAPVWGTSAGEERVGDYSAVDPENKSRYYTVCQGCREVGELAREVVRRNAGFWDLVKKDLGEA